MTYRITRDPGLTAVIDGLPAEALSAFAEVLVLLSIAPWKGAPVVASNPRAPVRNLVFGTTGLITYLVLEEQRRVDVISVVWLDS